MASENGVAVEDEIIVVENNETKPSALESQKEEQQSDNFEKTTTDNPDISENTENLDTSAQKVEANEANVQETKASEPVKKTSTHDSSSTKKSKMAKDKPGLKHSGTFSRSPRFLSHSISFPSRGACADMIKKSLGGISKNDVRNVPENGVKSKAPPSSVGASAKHTSLAPLPRTNQTTAAKSSSTNAAAGPSSEVSKSENERSEPRKAAAPIKIDEETRSTTTSTSTPRGWRSSTGSGFSFKLDERAEKRKEFFLKIEQKNQAKEIEKSNMQAKSKENQAAEIKKLRKSLTFKATPMPSFYKEPPPKFELKKIPITRPVSPKLGRKKGNTDAAKTSAGGESGSCSSPRINREQSNSAKGVTQAKNLVVSKKPTAKSQPKLQCRATSGKAKTETKSVKPKLETAEPSGETQKENAEKTEKECIPASNATNREEEQMPSRDATKPEEEQRALL